MSRSDNRSLAWSILPGLAVIVGSALVLSLIYGPPYLNYDASYSLVWAHDIAHGFTPDYGGFIAPTPHPLQTFVSFLALPLGGATTGFLAWLVMFAFGGIVWVVYLLGRELFNRPVGALAALIILTRPAFAKNAEAAYQDIPFVLFVCWALLLEVRRPHRGWPVLVLLALAGLLRPEAWVLAGIYWLYMFPERSWRDRWGLAALVLAAPVLWAISDWAISGDLLHSFHGTKDLAAQLDRPRSTISAPYWTAKFFGFTLREPLIVGVPIGCLFMILKARRQAWILLGVAAVMTGVFILSTIGGLPLIARYVLTPTVLLAIVYAAGVFGWLDLGPSDPQRAMWKWIGIGSLMLSVIYIPWHVREVNLMQEKIHNYQSIQANLRTFADSPQFQRFYRVCGRVSTTDHRPVPAFRYELGGPPGVVQSTGDTAHPLANLALYPASRLIAQKFYSAIPDLSAPHQPGEPGYASVYRTWAWQLYASPACVAAVKAGGPLVGVDRE
ncbi:MAG: ArnT family glycosyltransferase [Solirubrobacterales bacterium]